MKSARRFPVGAEIASDGATDVRVWAPARKQVEVAHGSKLRARTRLQPEAQGYFSGRLEGLKTGDRYAFLLDDDPRPYPDPASRFQPDGPHGPSEVVDPALFRWTDADWRGVSAHGQVVYELHVGTFTPEGTYAAATERLAWLADMGVTVIELMPLAEFAGRFGWGYDGVDLWAPSHLYGRPDDLRRFIDRAHALELGVILDAVYNHFGPDGNYLTQFSDDYFTDRYRNAWGAAINFDGANAGPVRELCVESAAYWVSEFHFDGLRLDATQDICDASEEHVIAAIARRAREAAGTRTCYLVAENEPQNTGLVRPAAAGGCGLDALWNDDFHHAARVALTGHNEAYYADYLGTPQELISALRWGYLYQGQRYAWQKGRRGTPALDLEVSCFVTYLENHDQVANSARGLRLATLVDGASLRAMTALMLLGPGTPMLFQGQEFGSTRPFVYFADHDAGLADKVAAGRLAFLSQFPSLTSDAIKAEVPAPGAVDAFASCKLDWSEAERHSATVALHRDLLRLRREDAAFAAARRDQIHGAVIAPEALALRSLCADGDRLVIANFGRDLRAGSVAEPLLAPPAGHRWRTLWSSEDPRYGGGGTSPVDTDDGLRMPGHATVVLAPEASP